ncbi:thioesterase family protein [Falsarthrobacter nasiphocae]|uniref:Acyl-CoA thioester hydrolase n=1 Tax=Falsarthrobacter nasiphocae TaxID=189863 RepID=A0AAE3YGB0_9MICC|nr:thioesterase family protein [Falsarthrobacter nasiphocae]MDR6892904.1 acyl-CoA thioester hydrolase [Falsarthrobacter nasiphocae]
MHTVSLQMRWGDLDQYRHVNNVRYVQYLEDARVRLMHQPISDFAPDHPRGGDTLWDLIGPGKLAFIARQEIEYREATGYSTEPLEVRIGVSSLGASSFDYACEILSEGRLKVVAEVSVVLVDEGTGRPVRLPEALRDALAALSCPPVSLRRRRGAS